MVSLLTPNYHLLGLLCTSGLLLFGTKGSTIFASNITTTESTTPSYEDRARTITQAQFGKMPRQLPREWIKLNETRWEHYNLTTCWNNDNKTRRFINPGLFFSSTFGYVKAEMISFQQYAYPAGRFWRNANRFERTCLCNRKLAYIKPDLTIEALNTEILYTRPTGNQVRLIWKWDTSETRMHIHSPRGMYQRAVTKYKLVALGLFSTYSSIKISCRKRILQRPLIAHEMMNYNSSDPKITDCVFRKSLYYCINCTTTGMVIAYEPHASDIIVQEEDPTQGLSSNPDDFREYMPGEHNFHPSITVWTDESGVDEPSLPEKIKWILPTFPNKFGRDFRDGDRPVKAPGVVPMFKYYPSLLASDQNCRRRIQRYAVACTTPVGGLELKLAYWKDIHYDSEDNLPRYSGKPLIVIGNGRNPLGKGQSAVPGSRRRKKRFFFTLMALCFTALMTVAVTTNLQNMINRNVDDLTDQMNSRFTRIEGDLKAIADELNELSLIGVARANKLNEVIRNNMRREQTNEERFRVLSNMVMANRNMILAQVDNYLSTIQTVQKMSLAEISINQLVLRELQQLTAKPIFDKSKAYFVRLKDGLISLREHAQEITAFREDYINKTDQQGERLQNARLELQQIRNETEISIQNWQDDLNRSIYINTSDFGNENISFVHLDGIIGEKFFDDFGTAVKTVANGTGVIIRSVAEGAGEILTQGIDGVSGIFGSGLSAIFGNLTGILTPIIIVIVVIGILICVVKVYPIIFPKGKNAPDKIRSRNNRAEMTTYTTQIAPRVYRREIVTKF